MSTSCILLGALVAALSTLSSVNGQVTVALRAPSLGTSIAYTVYYLNGSSTAQVGLFYLPACVATGQAVGGNGQYLRLTNTDTSTTVAEQGAFDLTPAATATLLWNTSSHDTLDPTYTGLYRCTTDVGNVTETYQLNVVVPPPVPSINASEKVSNETVHPISCTGQGYPEPTVTLMVENMVVTGTDTTNCAAGVCTKTRTASLVGSTYTPGDTINITCTVDINQPPFTCTATQNSTLQAQCTTTTLKTRTETRVVLVVAQCPAVNASGLNYKPIATTSTRPDTNVSIECEMGYVSNNSMAITNSTCQNTGVWQPSLPMCTSCQEECNDTNVVDCNRVMGMPIDCICGPNFQWTMGQCQQSTDPISSTVMTNMPSSPGVTDGGGIGTGAIVGIAVGGAVLAIVLIIIIILVIKKQPRASGKPI